MQLFIFPMCVYIILAESVFRTIRRQTASAHSSHGYLHLTFARPDNQTAPEYISGCHVLRRVLKQQLSSFQT